MKKADFIKTLKDAKGGVVVEMDVAPEVVTSSNGNEAIKIQTNKGIAYLTERFQDIFTDDIDADGALPTKWTVSDRGFLVKREEQPGNASSMFS